jgi:hypothetical protein
VYRDRTLTCPRCDHRSTLSVALSLDAAHAAAERRAILDDTFQRFPCASCGETLRADGPLIYLDFDAQLWIGVFPAPWERTWWDHEDEPRGAFDRHMIEHCPPLVRSWAPGFTIRAVFGLDQLREKLVAHDAGIDDRVLEAYKLDLLRGLGPYELGPSARPRLREVTAADAVFHVPRPTVDTPERCAVVRVPRIEIDRVAADRTGAWAVAINAVSAGPYVDLGRLLAPPPATAVA